MGVPAIQRCQSSSLLGMISIDVADKTSVIAAGRTLQRIWLEATRQGLSFQPYIGMTLLFQRFHDNEVDSVMTNKQCQHLYKVERQLKQGFEGCSSTLMAGFRIGYSDSQSPLTLRKPIVI